MRTKPKPTYPIEQARRLADMLVSLFSDACYQISVAGSVRRCRDRVHDVDLVAWAITPEIHTLDLFGQAAVSPADPARLIAQIRRFYALEPYPSSPKILRFDAEGLPVEIYLAEMDGRNFYALLQMRTGSPGHNAWLAMKARERGRYYKAGYGIFESDAPGADRIDDGSEEGIYRALGLPYPPPATRY